MQLAVYEGQGSAVTGVVSESSLCTWPPGPSTYAQWPPSTAEMQYFCEFAEPAVAVTMPLEAAARDDETGVVVGLYLASSSESEAVSSYARVRDSRTPRSFAVGDGKGSR